MTQMWLIIAGLSGFIAVALGAFGFHNLKPDMTPEQYENFALGNMFHLVHSAALLGVSILAGQGRKGAHLAGIGFVLGIFLFSGVLYTSWVLGPAIGMLAPFGGLSYMAGWILIAVSSLQGGHE